MCLKFIVYLDQMVPVTDLTSIVLQLLFCTVLLVLLPGSLEALATPLDWMKTLLVTLNSSQADPFTTSEASCLTETKTLSKASWNGEKSQC